MKVPADAEEFNPTGLSPESGANSTIRALWVPKDFSFEMINCSLLHPLSPLEEEQPRVLGNFVRGSVK